MTSQQEDRQQPVRIGVIGLGDMGLKHAEIYRGIAGAEVVALVDTRPDALAQHAGTLGVAPSGTFTSMDDFFAAVGGGSLKLDALDVCVPNSLHREATVRGLELGLEVLCEKPVADTLPAAEAIAAAAERSEGHVMFGFLYRYHPKVVAWMDEVARGLGRLVSGDVSVMRRDGIPDRPAFRNRRLTGGGPAVDLLPHALAVVVDALDMARPSHVMAKTVPQLSLDGDDVEDAAYATYRFDELSELVLPGALLKVETSWRAHLPAGEPDELWTIRLLGTEGAFTLPLPTGAKGAQAGYVAEQELFVARAGGRKPWPSNEMRHGLQVQQMVHGLYRSAYEGGALTQLS